MCLIPLCIKSKPCIQRVKVCCPSHPAAARQEAKSHGSSCQPELGVCCWEGGAQLPNAEMLLGSNRYCLCLLGLSATETTARLGLVPPSTGEGQEQRLLPSPAACQKGPFLQLCANPAFIIALKHLSDPHRIHK